MPRPTIGKLNERTLHRTFLREWRQHRGYNQDQAADIIGIDRTTLSRIERGLTPYNQPFLEAAAEAYSCDVADLLVRNPMDPEGIWSLWDHAQVGEKRMIVEIAKGVLKTGTGG